MYTFWPVLTVLQFSEFPFHRKIAEINQITKKIIPVYYTIEQELSESAQY